MKKLLIFILLIFSLTIVNSQENDGILYHAEKEILFTPLETPDIIIVNVIGDNYIDATYEILIINIPDDTLYVYDGEILGNLFMDKPEAGQLSSDELERTVKSFADGITTHSIVRFTNDLPEYLEPQEYYEQYYEEIAVNKEKYNELRKNKYPILRHQTYYEGYTEIYYDPELKKVTTLLNGGT